jgi:hypothetical protein
VHEAKERVATYQPGGALVGYIVVGRSTEGDMKPRLDIARPFARYFSDGGGPGRNETGISAYPTRVFCYSARPVNVAATVARGRMG